MDTHSNRSPGTGSYFSPLSATLETFLVVGVMVGPCQCGGDQACSYKHQPRLIQGSQLLVFYPSRMLAPARIADPPFNYESNKV